MDDLNKTNSKETTVSEFEKLKLIYEKAVGHHKYYLSWRQYLLSGFFAVESILLLCCYKLYSDTDIFVKYFSPYAAFLMPLVSLLFYFFDDRNRELYQSCQKTAVEIEKQLFPKQLNLEKESNVGLFFDLNKSWKPKKKNEVKDTPTHRWTMGALFISVALIGIVLGILICNKL